MNKKERQQVFDKYDGKCAYCGCELSNKWHVDHANPLLRFTKIIYGDYTAKDTGLPATDEDFRNRNVKRNPTKKIHGSHNPENHTIDNMMPACVSCNIYKGGCDIETFRMVLTNTIRGLNKHYPQYKFAKRYGLVKETGNVVQFYFEIQNHPSKNNK